MDFRAAAFMTNAAHPSAASDQQTLLYSRAYIDRYSDASEEGSPGAMPGLSLTASNIALR